MARSRANSGCRLSHSVLTGMLNSLRGSLPRVVLLHELSAVLRLELLELLIVCKLADRRDNGFRASVRDNRPVVRTWDELLGSSDAGHN